VAEQLFPKVAAVAEAEPPHAADYIAGKIVFHPAAGHSRMPLIVAVEVAQHSPHPLDGGVNDG